MTADVEQRLIAVEQRNKRVEMDKAWEVSWVRRALILAITYIVACLVLILIGTDQPILGAFIPALGYLVSTFSLPFAKKMWIQRR